MEETGNSSPVKVEKYKTREGEEFLIRRRARPGRRCQKPRATGEELSCPFCGSSHPVLYHMMREGEEGERKLRTWECPKAGRMSLNVSQKFQDYIGSITMRRGQMPRKQKDAAQGGEKVRTLKEESAALKAGRAGETPQEGPEDPLRAMGEIGPT